MTAPKLTPRERAILSLLLQGMTTEQIAQSLRLSPNTVRNHVCAILRKFGVERRAQLPAAVIALQRRQKKRLRLP